MKIVYAIHPVKFTGRPPVYVFIFRLNTHVKPLIWIESVIERHAHSRVEIMVKAKSQFKRRSTANNVEIMIPVPNDADSPKFKTTIGKLNSVSVLTITFY